MKRTRLLLDERLLEEARRLSGERTYSAVEEQALEAYVRRARASRIFELGGTNRWEGGLGQMRRTRRRDLLVADLQLDQLRPEPLRLHEQARHGHRQLEPARPRAPRIDVPDASAPLDA